MHEALRKIHWIGDGLKHLQSYLGSVGAGLPDEQDLQGLVGTRGAPHLLLGTFTAKDVEEALGRVGIAARMREMGLPELQVQLDTNDRVRHTMRIYGIVDGESLLVAETALRLDTFTTDQPFARPLHGRSFRMLFILWLLMQNPKASFRPDRPALPGQVHPGLGLGRAVMKLYQAMARHLGCDGIVNSPEFGHTGVLYSPHYRFLDPDAEGRLIALRRDLARLSLAEASWALHTGCVLLDGKEPRIFRWVPEDQVLALTEPLISYFRSRSYVRAVKRAAKSYRFRFDALRFRKIQPLEPDGSPRVRE